MLGLGKLTLSTGYILAGLFSCDPPGTPVITVNFQNNPAKFNNEHDSAYMMELKQGSVSPEYGGEFPVVDGITSGSFHVEHSVDFSSTVRPLLKSACPGVKHIDVTLVYDATIYVDHRYPPGTCRYELTKDHEMKHVNTDVTVINEFVPYIQQLLRTTAEQWQSTTAVDEAKLEETENAMGKQVSEALDNASDTMQRTRNLRQQLVDSHEEYARVSEACPREQ